MNLDFCCYDIMLNLCKIYASIIMMSIDTMNLISFYVIDIMGLIPFYVIG
jgi:hypothetical protein